MVLLGSACADSLDGFESGDESPQQLASHSVQPTPVAHGQGEGEAEREGEAEYSQDQVPDTPQRNQLQPLDEVEAPQSTTPSDNGITQPAMVGGAFLICSVQTLSSDKSHVKCQIEGDTPQDSSLNMPKIEFVVMQHEELINVEGHLKVKDGKTFYTFDVPTTEGLVVKANIQSEAGNETSALIWDVAEHTNLITAPIPSDLPSTEEGQNLIKNGDFETFALNPGSWMLMNDLPGWNLRWADEDCPNQVKAEVWNGFSGITAPSGQHHIELDSGGGCQGSNLVISQVLNIEPGQLLSLNFSFRTRPGSQGRLVVRMGDDVIYDQLHTEAQWHEVQLDWQAGPDQTIVDLSFEDEGIGDDHGTLLDNVRVFTTP